MSQRFDLFPSTGGACDYCRLISGVAEWDDNRHYRMQFGPITDHIWTPVERSLEYIVTIWSGAPKDVENGSDPD